jgi:exodeoxyribonuclease VII large subunit
MLERRLGDVFATRARATRVELDGHARRLESAVTARSRTARVELTRSGASLSALSPFATLERGYAIVRDPDGHVITEARSQTPGASLDVLVARGALHVRVEDVRDSRS